METPVKGYSMQPTLNQNVKDPNAYGDMIYINKYATLSRNDLVVAKVDWSEYLIIKRLVGVPGDKIQIKDETTHYGLYVNDCLLYTKEKNGTNESFIKTGTNGYYGDYLNFLDGYIDHWQDEKPQNVTHLIKEDENGKYIQLGEDDYFLMGDNWGHTTDSVRYGPESINSIIGKVDLIVDVTNTNPFFETWFFLKKLFS